MVVCGWMWSGAVCSMVVGPGRTVGEHMINDSRLALVSFTGSSEIGIHVSEVVHRRFGRTILELGGNNAPISALCVCLSAWRGLVGVTLPLMPQSCRMLTWIWRSVPLCLVLWAPVVSAARPCVVWYVVRSPPHPLRVLNLLCFVVAVDP
jgi:hypothetical protein